MQGIKPSKTPALAPPWDRRAPLKYDQSNLCPQLPGYRFNGGPWRDASGLGLVWRTGWAGSDLVACRLDAGWRPAGPPRWLSLSHPAAEYGREDPQPFLYGGNLHVAFVGVQGDRGRVTKTNVLFARLRDDLTVAGVWAPAAPGVPYARWEKNWGFFDHDGDLFAVYSIDDHRVLRVRAGAARWAHAVDNPLTWDGGERRGGCPPVRVGDEYWCFFHDRVDRVGFRPLYRMGLYTFEARPPFRPARHVPVPLAVADPGANPGNYCDCLFPRGAVRDGPDWVVGCGVHDRWNELRAFSHADLERRLVPA